MKARKVIIFALLAILLLSTLACGGGEEEEEGVTEIRFGLGLPLSGLFGAAVGIPSKQAFELTADRISVFEVGGKQYRWKVIIEDNLGGSAEGGLATTTKFIYEDGVDFMLKLLVIDTGAPPGYPGYRLAGDRGADGAGGGGVADAHVAGAHDVQPPRGFVFPL